MVVHRDDEPTVFTRPDILGALIGVSIVLVLGLIVAVIPERWSNRGWVKEVWRRMMDHLRQTPRENPRESMHLPIQTPPPPSPPPPSPIPIPARHPGRPFDTFDYRPPIHVSDITRIGKQIGQQGGG